MTAMPSAAELKAFETAVGYTFRNRDLLLEALTHASADTGKRSRRKDLLVNERLEFLGDRVLGLLAARALICTFDKAPEGDLAPRLNALVRKETCAEVARECGLPAVIVLAEAEASAGGRDKPAILGDACEALIGGIFLDGDLEPASDFFNRFWGERVHTLTDIPRDPKTRLQEWAQARWRVTPTYEVRERSGPDHEPQFVVEVQVDVSGIEPATGTGPSKRAAEQAAAEAILERENIPPAAP